MHNSTEKTIENEGAFPASCRRRTLGCAFAALLGFLSGEAAAAQTPPQPSENDAPVFSEGASTTREFAENAEAGIDVDSPVIATDADGHRLTYGLDGEDVDSFALDSRNGQLRTRGGIDYDYEVKDRYTVTVRAEDGHGARASIVVVVELIDELERPSKPDKPTFVTSTRSTLTVGWTAPANTGPEIRDYDGQFRVAETGSFEAGWDRIGAVTEATITDLEQDTTYEVQVRARNADGEGDWSEAVEARTAANQAPVFDGGPQTTRELEENTAAGETVGAPIAATDPEGDPLIYSLEGTDEIAFIIDSGTGQLRTRAGVAYDYETKTAYSVTVRTEDDYGDAAASVVAVSVLDVHEAGIVAVAGWDLTVVAGGTAWLNGTGSTAGQGETYSWSFVSWPGDSAPALDDSASATPSFGAAAEGTYVVRLTVSLDGSTATDEVSVVARPSTEADELVNANLLVDTNRDGTVDSSDETGEDSWTAESGAVFGPNTDDDDGDGVRDGWDDQVNGDADLLEMAPVVVKRIPGLHRNHTVFLEMTYSAASSGPRMFYQRADGTIAPLIGRRETQAELPLEQLVAGDLRLYVESRHGRDIGFDGHLTLSLTVEEGETETAISQDSVALRGSPILFSNHLQTAERVFVVETGPKGASNRKLVSALNAHLPASVDLYRIDYWEYRDRWIQDSMQTGYAQRPSAGGTKDGAVHTQLHRGGGLRPFLPDEYLGPDAGFALRGGEYWSSFNYGGNVEVIPPYSHGQEDYPLGRIVIGGYPDGQVGGMAQRQIDFFNAQEVQGPVIKVDTSWLMVAHVDEIFSVIPNRNAESDARPWVVAIGSTNLAIELLEEAVEDGFGDTLIFEGRRSDETTPQEILDDSALLAMNDLAQARIDTVRDRLIAEVGLQDADFREVPALFVRFANRLVAYIPSVQNLLVVDDLLFVPDPEGPVVHGKDIWRQATLDAVDDLGLTTHFVDVYDSYHVLLGAIHCGTNVERSGSTTAWWLEDSR